MTIQSLINKWKYRNIEDWGAQISPDYKQFQKDYKSALKSMCEQNGFELSKFNVNHYDFSVVFKSVSTGMFYYMSISDVRYWPDEWKDHVLYRTMSHSEDWRGGSNWYCRLEYLAESLKKLDKQTN